MEHLPSKKLIFISLTALVIVGASFLLSSEPAKLTKNPSDNLTSEKSSALGAPDSDNDGLSDWEEKLWKTNPLNPDSNNNGIPDGKEFESVKRYPDLTAELEDLGATYGLGSGGLGAKSNNLTDSLFRGAAARYGLVGGNGTPDDAAKLAIVNSLARDFSPTSLKKNYSASTISVLDDESFETTQKYFAEILAAFNQHRNIYDRDPLVLINSWLDTGDEIYMDQLTTLQNSFSALANDVAKLAVPKQLVGTHLEFVNNIYQAGVILNEVKNAPEDPIKGMLGTARYIHNKSERTRIVASLLNYFDTKILEASSLESS